MDDILDLRNLLSRWSLLCNFVWKILDSGFIPHQWKTTNVIPIFKKGNRKLPSNYRPISLTSVTCKTFESLIRDVIMSYLLKNGLLAKEQHGFMPRRCYSYITTTSVILVLLHKTEGAARGRV